jgi:serine/threonine protein kinase
MASQDSTDGGQQLLLGKMLLERGLITPDQLREALAERARSLSDGSARPLGIILVAKGFLSDSQLVNLLAEQAPRPPSSSSGSTINIPALAPQMASLTRLGKYELESELGRGGMGVVYQATDMQLNRRVALKLMLSNPSADSKEASLDEERFVQEAQLSAKLKHPNIVTVYEAGIMEGRRFLAMEMIDGQALSDWRRGEGISLKQQVEVLRDVALAVHHAHEQGILHRDLKPRNVLVTGSHHPYVTDFGLAKSLGAKVNHSLTGSGAVVGTPAYMSPEQAQGHERVDWRTDIYSLGVMLYEILTGRTPFTGDSPIEILMKVVKDPVPPPSTVVEGAAALGLDKTIENICLKALAKKDRDRYVTAKAFAEDLTRWLNGEQVKVHAPKVKRSYAWAYIVGVAAGLLLVIGATIVMTVGRHPSVEAELDQGRKFMELHNYLDARIWFSRALAKDPANQEALKGEREAHVAADAVDRENQDKLRTLADAQKKEAERKRLEAEEKARTAQQEGLPEDEVQKLLAAAKSLDEEASRNDAAAKEVESRLYPTGKKPPKVDPGPAPDDPWRESVNLLKLVDLQRGVLRGTWILQDDKMLSDREPFARVEIPYLPPEEYDLRVVFSRKSGNDAVAIILPTRWGRSFTWEMGAWGNTVTGFQAVREPTRSPNHPWAVHSTVALENERVYSAVIQVRKQTLKVLLDGQVVSTWRTDYLDLSLDPNWKLRGNTHFGLGSLESPTEFHRVDLLEVTGKGRHRETLPILTLKAVPVSGIALKPGIVGDYFYGNDFEVQAYRRVDAAVNFNWGDGAAWPAGPVDGFSCRWSGYLQVPKKGKYLFAAASDDGARLFIDGVQVLANWRLNADASRSAPIWLEEGFHRIVAEHFEVAYLAVMVLSWGEVGGLPPAPIGAKSYFYDPQEAKPFQPPRFPEFLGTLAGHTNSVTSAAFKPDGKMLATASEDRKVKLWLIQGRRESTYLSPQPQGVLTVAWSPDGKRIATGAEDNRIRIYDASTGSEVRTLEGHGAFVTSVAFSPDGTLLASGSTDRTIKIWDLESFTERATLVGHMGGVEGVAFHPEGKLLGSASLDRTARVWDVEKAKEVLTLKGHAGAVQCLAFSPESRTLATGSWDSLIKVWSTDSGKELQSFRAHHSEVLCIAYSGDGKLLASGGTDAMVRIWEAGTGKELRTLPGHTARVNGLAFAREGRLLVSASFDTTARLWDLSSW